MFVIRVHIKNLFNKFVHNCSVSIKNLYMNDKYLFIVITNDKPSNKLCNILKLENKTKLRKQIFILLIFCINTVIIISTCFTNACLTKLFLN